MLNFNSILIFSEDPKALVDFYKKVFEKEKADWESGGFSGFQVGSGFVTIGPHDKVHGSNSNPERIMFNLESEDLMGEFERIKGLGAKVIANPYHPTEEDETDEEGKIATFEDPDGNYFQVMTPWKG